MIIINEKHNHGVVNDIDGYDHCDYHCDDVNDGDVDGGDGHLQYDEACEKDNYKAHELGSCWSLGNLQEINNLQICNFLKTT